MDRRRRDGGYQSVRCLVQNFRPGFVQGQEETPEEGRPSRAEVRYYGATED
jgi:hypothetical protein